MVSIRDGVHSGWYPFGIVSIRDCVHSGWCPFGIVSIRDCVFWDRVQDPNEIICEVMRLMQQVIIKVSHDISIIF